MNAFSFPQPGERQNTAAIPVPEALLVNLVVFGVRGYHDNDCQDRACPDCENARISCVQAFQLLPSFSRDVVDNFLLVTEQINPGDWRR